MGDDSGGSREQPAHTVTLTRSYYIGVCEVTQSQYEQVIGSNPSQMKDENKPVERVNWDDMNAYCVKLSALPAEQAAGRVYRLPTEAEWEYACRAGTKSSYSFGNEVSKLAEYAFFRGGSGGGKTNAVGTLLANPWGLYDMHGNVWECCSDGYEGYPKDDVTDPQGSLTASDHVLRGGSWMVDASSCRSAFRMQYDPTFSSSGIGFRVAMSLPTK